MQHVNITKSKPNSLFRPRTNGMTSSSPKSINNDHCPTRRGKGRRNNHAQGPIHAFFFSRSLAGNRHDGSRCKASQPTLALRLLSWNRSGERCSLIGLTGLEGGKMLPRNNARSWHAKNFFHLDQDPKELFESNTFSFLFPTNKKFLC